MASSKPPAQQRPASPVDEDLQRLYNEVWAGFSEEESAPTNQDDQIVYDAQPTKRDPGLSIQVNPAEMPPAPSGYPPPFGIAPTDYLPETPKTPGRRRLPPTPAAASSVQSFSMPEPEPYIPSTRPQLYNSASSNSFASASGSNLERHTTASSGSSVQRLPPTKSNPTGLRGPYDQDDRTQVSSSDYSSFRSHPSYSSTTSYNTHVSQPSTGSTNGFYRPPGALAPTLPVSYYEKYNEEKNPYMQPEFNAYEDRANPYIHPTTQPTHHNRSHSNISFEQPSNRSQPTLAPVPAPPPPPPKDDRIRQYAQVEPPKFATAGPYVESPVEPSGPPSSIQPTHYHSTSTTSIPQEAYPQDRSSSIYEHEAPDGRWEQTSQPYENSITGTSNVDVAPRPMIVRGPTDMLHAIADYAPHHEIEVQEEVQDEFWEDEEEEDENRFVNFSLLSNLAVLLRDNVERKTHVKGSIPYPRSFTGKDVVSTIQSQIQRELAINHRISTSDRRVALQAARSLQSQLFFYDVEWGGQDLQDGVDDVYMFLDDQEGGAELIAEREELPTSVITMLTRCYSPSCDPESPCYAYSCPRKGNFSRGTVSLRAEPAPAPKKEAWKLAIDDSVLDALPASEIERQKIIHELIAREQQYLQDLDLVESLFIKPLRSANPPVVALHLLDDFIDEVFGNILDLRECNRRLLEVLRVRQREEGPIILRIGDIFLDTATEFRYAYPTYLGHLPIAEQRLKDETESNPAFKLFIDQAARQQTGRSGELKHFLNRPAEHLAKYPTQLKAALQVTTQGNTDAEFLKEAITAISNLQSIAQLRTFQVAMGRGTPGKWEWHDLLGADGLEKFTKQEGKRQAIIFELIKTEMAYVRDLENIQHIYIDPLYADPSVIPREKVGQFVEEVFHNYADILRHHRKLVDAFHEIQREQHPNIQSITAPLFDAALNWRDAYLEYIPNYPLAAYRIDEEMADNPNFKTFVESAVRHPDAHRLDMKNFINRPIPRLLRYELLLKGILEETPPESEDHEAIPNVIEVIKALGKETEPGVQTAKHKVELRRYNRNLIFKPGETIDMDLSDEKRTLVHSGKLLRQPESGLEWNGWSELTVLLFDNYLVMTKTREKDGVTKYVVNRRPIPLDLLTLVNFTDPPTQRGAGLLRRLGGQAHEAPHQKGHGASPETPTDARNVYPFTLHYNGRLGGPCILYAESAAIRNEWKEKLESALGLHKVVQDSAKVFEPEYLSRDTFVMPLASAVNPGPAWNQDNRYTGEVKCSVPFNTADGRALVAIGCSEGVWIGFRHDPRSVRRVLHLKMVTQCAMLEDFGIFLVLADKALFAYHIEALVPSSPHSAHTSLVPQKLSGTKDVHFFSVGQLKKRTFIIYMKKKGLDSIFRVLEPVDDKIGGRAKQAAGLGSRFGFRSAKSEWFSVYRDFFLPSDSFDVIFLKARIVIFCAKGFEIMNLDDFDSITIPQKDDPKYMALARRCESAKPLGMFRSAEDEFLLCYDEFGVYVDKHGDPSRNGVTVEWEGTAVRAAFHAPYILLFDTRFIEIRHVQTGRLTQIIPGTDIRCVYDGRGVDSQQQPPPLNRDDQQQQEAQVHFVMNTIESAPTGGSMRTKNIVQHVCELVPTVALPPIAPMSAASMFSPATTNSPYSAGPQGLNQPYGQSPRPDGSYVSRQGYPDSPSPHSADIRSMHSWRS